MRIKNKFTGEVKDFEYDFMGKAEAKRLLDTGQWTKIKSGDMNTLGGLGNMNNLGGTGGQYGINTNMDFFDDDEEEVDWGY